MQIKEVYDSKYYTFTSNNDENFYFATRYYENQSNYEFIYDTLETEEIFIDKNLKDIYIKEILFGENIGL